MVVEVAASWSLRCPRISWRSGCDSAFQRRASPVTRRGVVLTGAAYHLAEKIMQKIVCRIISVTLTVLGMQTCEHPPLMGTLPVAGTPPHPGIRHQRLGRLVALAVG